MLRDDLCVPGFSKSWFSWSFHFDWGWRYDWTQKKVAKRTFQQVFERLGTEPTYVFIIVYIYIHVSWKLDQDSLTLGLLILPTDPAHPLPKWRTTDDILSLLSWCPFFIPVVETRRLCYQRWFSSPPLHSNEKRLCRTPRKAWFLFKECSCHDKGTVVLGSGAIYSLFTLHER